MSTVDSETVTNGRARAATTAVFFANGFGIGAWAAAIPAIKQSLGLSNAALGCALLAFAAGAILTMPPTGRIAARTGSGPVTLVGGVLFACALALPSQAPGLVLLALAIFLLGACNGVLAAAMNAHAALVERRRGIPIMSSFHAAFSLGGLAGAAAAGAVLVHGVTAETCLALAGGGILAVMLAGAKWLCLVLHERMAPGPAFARPRRALLGIAVLAFLCMMTEGAMADWSAVYLATSLHASAALAAAGYAAFSLAMAAGRLVGDGAVRALTDRWIVRAGALLAACGFTLAVWAPHLGAVLLGFGLVGIGLANIVPVLFSAGGRAWPQAPSVGVAMTVTAGFAGFLTGPPVIGLTAQLVGLRLALGLLIAATLAVAVAGLARTASPAPGRVSAQVSSRGRR